MRESFIPARAICFLSLFLITAKPLRAEKWHVGGSAGAVIYLGNKTSRMGVFASAWIYCNWIQINAGLRGYYNFRNLGPSGKYWEYDGYAGFLFSWGKKDSIRNPFIYCVSNQTRRRYALGYSYNLYRDPVGTSQSTGTIALQLYRISIITENDLFAGKYDHFRTAAATVQYRYHRTVFAVSTVLWTGGEKGPSIRDTDYPARIGYRIPALYGGYSSGLLSLQVQQDLGYGQVVRADAGIDAEQVRHAVQNKLIHDLVFLPEKWHLSGSSHVPMLDAESNPYLFQSGQKIKKPTPYFNLAANPSIFY